MSTVTDERYDELMSSTPEEYSTTEIIRQLDPDTRVKKANPDLVEITREMYTLDEAGCDELMARLNHEVDLAEAMTASTVGEALQADIKKLYRARLRQATGIASRRRSHRSRIHRDWQGKTRVSVEETAHRQQREEDHPKYFGSLTKEEKKKYQAQEEKWRLAGRRVEEGYIQETAINLAHTALQKQDSEFPWWLPGYDEDVLPWYVNPKGCKYGARDIDEATWTELYTLMLSTGAVQRSQIAALIASAAAGRPPADEQSATRQSPLYGVQYTDERSLELAAAKIELAGRANGGAHIPLGHLTEAIRYDSSTAEERGETMREHLRVSDAAWHRKRGGMGSHTVLAAEWDRRRFYAIGILTGSGERIDEWRHTQQEEAASSTQSTSGGLQARARSRARSRERGRSSRGDTEGRRSVRAPRATRAHLEAQRMAAQKTSDERLFAAILTRSIALIGEQYQHRAPYCEACSQGDCVGHWWNDPQEISRIPGRHLLPGYHTTEQNQASGESGPIPPNEDLPITHDTVQQEVPNILISWADTIPGSGVLLEGEGYGSASINSGRTSPAFSDRASEGGSACRSDTGLLYGGFTEDDFPEGTFAGLGLGPPPSSGL